MNKCAKCKDSDVVNPDTSAVESTENIETHSSYWFQVNKILNTNIDTNKLLDTDWCNMMIQIKEEDAESITALVIKMSIELI